MLQNILLGSLAACYVGGGSLAVYLGHFEGSISNLTHALTRIF